MYRRTAAGSAVAALAVLTSAARAQTTLPGEPIHSIAIVGVNVLPMDRPGVLPGMTVLIEGGVITRLGPQSEVRIPDSARVLDGAGKYLLPGFADMHAHVWPPAELDLLLANGVTLVREMFGYGVHLALRENIRQGRRAGPRLIVASPIFEGSPPAEQADVIVTRDRIIVDDSVSAAAAVRTQIARGYELIKVYNNLPAAAYAGIVVASREQGVDVGGHVPFAVGLRGVLAAGQRTIEHLRGYVLEAVPPGAPDQPAADYRSRLVSWRHADTTVLRVLAEETARVGAWNVPTLVTLLLLLPADRIHDLTSRQGWRSCMRGRRADPLASRRAIPYFSVMSDEDFRATQDGVRVQKQLVRMLHESGAPLLVGTDISPVGYSFHWELEELVDAGVPPWDVLRAATLGAAEYLGLDDRLGAVSEGKQAELVLLRGNPLDDIRRTAELEAVYRAGRLINAAQLDSMRAAACDTLNEGAR